MEEWKKINGFEFSYEISNYGRIKSLSRKCDFINNYTNQLLQRTTKEKILKQTTHPSGYKYISLHLNKKIITFRIHRLVAVHFLKNPDLKKEINHKNGIKSDNKYDNLEWVTAKENSVHSSLNNLTKKGERHYKTNLTKEDVFYIRKSEKTNKELGIEFSIDYRSIWQIRKRITWKHL